MRSFSKICALSCDTSRAVRVACRSASVLSRMCGRFAPSMPSSRRDALTTSPDLSGYQRRHAGRYRHCSTTAWPIRSALLTCERQTAFAGFFAVISAQRPSAHLTRSFSGFATRAWGAFSTQFGSAYRFQASFCFAPTTRSVAALMRMLTPCWLARASSTLMRFMESARDVSTMRLRDGVWPDAGPNDEERDQPRVAVRASLVRLSSSVSSPI